MHAANSAMPALIGGLLILSGALVPTALAEEAPLPPVAIFMQIAPEHLRGVTKEIYSTSTAEDIITEYAVHYNIDPKPLIDTLHCESNFDPAAIGDFGTSFGIAQIHLPAHAEVTKQEALDPLWSINWAAQMFAAGHANLWSCYNQLYKNSPGN